jgi:glycosyltransferase involved in cell wall biosynthesis
MAPPHTGGDRARKTYKVLMIAPTSFFADYGCHVRILEEALILRQMGNRVTICTYHNGRDVADLDIRRTVPIPWRTRYEVGASRHKIGFDVLLLLKALSVAIRAKPNIVHGHIHEGALIGYTVSKLLGVPLVFDFQGSMTSEMIDHHFLNPEGRFYGPARWLEQLIVRLPSAIITSSSHAAGLLTNDFHCPSDKITAIPDCVNADFFTPGQSEHTSAALKATLGIPPERQIVVYLGLLAEWQGTGLLLQAAAQLISRRPDVHFLIMGFPAVETYRCQAQDLGLASHVTFTGKIPYEQAPSFLALGDLAVAPKTSTTEGSGKLLNYMAMGLPTVAFDVPVSREYLDSLGVYAQAGDASRLADALETLLVHRERAQALGQNLRRRAIERYSWTAAGARIMDVYDRVHEQ